MDLDEMRAMFAAAAMGTILDHHYSDGDDATWDGWQDIARTAFHMADVMMEERARGLKEKREAKKKS